jgi:hypothetical protein
VAGDATGVFQSEWQAGVAKSQNAGSSGTRTKGYEELKRRVRGDRGDEGS